MTQSNLNFTLKRSSICLTFTAFLKNIWIDLCFIVVRTFATEALDSYQNFYFAEALQGT